MKNEPEVIKTQKIQSLLAMIWQSGGRAWREGETLFVKPKALAQKLAPRIKEHKAAIMALLAFLCPICGRPTQSVIEPYVRRDEKQITRCRTWCESGHYCKVEWL